MTDENENVESSVADENDNSHDHDVPETPDADVTEQKLKKLVAEELKDIKAKLDKAYKERDQARKDQAKLLDENKRAKLEALEKEGKELEALRIRYKEMEERLQEAEGKNDALSRDVSLKGALSKYDFKNTKSSDLAFRDILNNLVKQEDGSWIAVSGQSIDEYVTEYAMAEENDFLFKPKRSSGTGSVGGNLPTKSKENENVSLFDLPQSKILDMAAKGELKKRR
jgi:hypothetical protein